MHHEQSIRVEGHEDELAPPFDRADARTADRVHERFRLGIANDRWKTQLAANDGPVDEVRPQVGGDRLDLRQLRHAPPPAFSCRPSSSRPWSRPRYPSRA